MEMTITAWDSNIIWDDEDYHVWFYSAGYGVVVHKDVYKDKVGSQRLPLNWMAV